MLVACRRNASSTSPAAIPEPLSATAIRSAPPPSTSIWTAVAPASSAFSSSSLTTDAGRSITSPAAIFAANWGGMTRIAPISVGWPAQGELLEPRQLGLGLERGKRQDVEVGERLPQAIVGVRRCTGLTVARLVTLDLGQALGGATRHARRYPRQPRDVNAV